MTKNKPVESFSISRFINEQTIGGIILIFAAIVAIVWANSAFYESYHFVWHEFKMGFSFGDFELKGSLHHWINDGLMAIFFFMIGLEIKREILGGELSTLKKATLPIMAAVGGMFFPALLYALIVINYPEMLNGWGIPMATDIAFALGLLAMLGKKVNINLKIFLTALAIADDLGAIMVIAIFYTESIDFTELLTAGIFMTVLITANYFGVRRALFYAVIGLFGVWLSFLFSGVHATIAGVLIALTIPARTKIDEDQYVRKMTDLTNEFEENMNDIKLLSKTQVHVLAEIEKLNDQAQTPLQKLEHALHPISTYFIIPIFALANAGVHIEGNFSDMVFHPVSIGIIFGLVAGKFLGISLFSFLMVKIKMAELPEGVNWRQLIGASFLAGIGFTMSIFISELAFDNEGFKQIAKVGIMSASVIAAAIGMTLLATGKDKQ
ncbi:MAG TPA: Na+/H+ antiporter NhaA [Bacteroidales bacterium]